MKDINSFCILSKAISYGNCRMKIPYNISLFFKGVFVINYGIEIKIVSLLFWSREGKGEKGMFVIKLQD